MTKKQLSDLAVIQISIGHCVNRGSSAEIIELMEKHLALIDDIVSEQISAVIPEVKAMWSSHRTLRYLNEDYIKRIAEKQIGIIQATELKDPERMAWAQQAYFGVIEKIIEVECSKELTLKVKYINIINNKKSENNV